MFVPYVSITDFMDAQQVRSMLAILRRHRFLYRRRRLGVGVMMSRKTMHGEPTKWENAFPKKEIIADIFISDPDVYNVLHYADYDRDRAIIADLEEAIQWGGSRLQALQLDMIWPDPYQLRLLKTKYPNLHLILQANTVALNEVGNDPQRFIKRLRTYENTLTCILLDKSMGKGLGMDALALLPFAHAIDEHVPYLALAAAGGLGPDTLNLATPLIAEFGGISLDAQGRLRPSGNALDPIDWTMAGEYLRRALKHIDDTIFESR